MPSEESEGSIDLTNLEKTLAKLESKYEELNKFKLLLFGILIGAIISAPVQLLILPFSYEENTLKYHNIIIFKDLPVEIYVLSIILILLLSIVVIILIYKTFFLGITIITTKLKYTGDYKKIYQDLRKFLKEECEYLNLKLRTSDDRKIVCHRGKDMWEKRMRVLTLTFRPDLDILEITFDPEDKDSITLINKIREKYS